MAAVGTTPFLGAEVGHVAWSAPSALSQRPAGSNGPKLPAVARQVFFDHSQSVVAGETAEAEPGAIGHRR